jgi:hypothetical protein
MNNTVDASIRCGVLLSHSRLLDSFSPSSVSFPFNEQFFFDSSIDVAWDLSNRTGARI